MIDLNDRYCDINKKISTDLHNNNIYVYISIFIYFIKPEIIISSS